MGTLSTELAPHAKQLTGPRVYADANMPAGIVSFMRERLGWDVLFVMEHPDLRRAPDVEHYRLAHRLHRTLVTLDRDYLDDRRFPPAEGSGVVVVWAPDERLLARTLRRVHDAFFGAGAAGLDPALPLAGRKVVANTDWKGEGI